MMSMLVLRDGHSTDGADSALAALAVEVLVAIVEGLVPGVRGVAGVLFAGPVPGWFEGGLEVGVQQRLFLAGGQLDADGCGPCDGLVPRKVGFGLMGDEDQVMGELACGAVDDDASVTLTFSSGIFIIYTFQRHEKRGGDFDCVFFVKVDEAAF